MAEPNESTLRSRAARLGFALRKSRRAVDGLDNKGGFAVIDVTSNFVVAGWQHDLDLEDVAHFLKEAA